MHARMRAHPRTDVNVVNVKQLEKGSHWIATHSHQGSKVNVSLQQKRWSTAATSFGVKLLLKNIQFSCIFNDN